MWVIEVVLSSKPLLRSASVSASTSTSVCSNVTWMPTSPVLLSSYTHIQKSLYKSQTDLSCGNLQTQECQSLMRVVRELTENRSKLVCARTNLAEQLAEMQHEYMRLMRVADLSRVVSKENVAKTAKVMKTLKQVRGGCGTIML